MTDTKITARECRFATHIPSKHPDDPDIHLIKEILHYEDGTKKPNIRYMKDYKRDFYVTLDNKRNHKQKKEQESLENLRKYTCTQSELRDKVAQALGKSWSHDYLKKLASSPYLYGTDISSTSLIKSSYMKKYPDVKTPYDLSVLDIETDVVNGTEEILMVSLTFNHSVYAAVVSSFLTGYTDPVGDTLKLVDKYISKYVNGKKVELVVVDSVYDAIKYVFDKAHLHMPDWIAIWNIDYDMPRIISAIENAGKDPADVFSHPELPKKLRRCKYKEGRKKKVTSSGKVTPINPASQWHVLSTTSSFQFIDAMCVFRQLRIQEQEESSYSLDNILNKVLGIRKLKFKEADKYSGLKWHQFMQTNYKLEYIVYNMFDTISILELDDHTKDLTLTLPAFAASTDFSDFNSQPKRIADSLHDFAIERNAVMGTVGASYDDEEPKDKVLDLKNWIMTLPSHMSSLGRCCIAEDPNMRTGMRTDVFDSDQVSAYPSDTVANNVSKSTTKREIITIKGIPEKLFRMQNLNMLFGSTNAVEYSTNMFNFPKPDELLDL